MPISPVGVAWIFSGTTHFEPCEIESKITISLLVLFYSYFELQDVFILWNLFLFFITIVKRRSCAGVENVLDHGTIGPRKFLGLPENIKFQKKKRVFGWPDINVNFSLAENIFNLRMAKTDALINRTPPPPHPGEMWGIYGE